MADIVTELTSVTSGWLDADFAPGAFVDASRFRRRQTISRQLYAPGTTIVNGAFLFYVPPLTVMQAGELVGIEAAIATAATSVTRTVTVDVEEVTAGGGTPIMQTPLVVKWTTPVRTMIAGTFSDRSVDLTKFYRINVTVSGGSGAQAKGLLVALVVDHGMSGFGG